MIKKYKKLLSFILIACSLIYGLTYFISISQYKEHNIRYQVVDESSKLILDDSNKCNSEKNNIKGKFKLNFKLNF
jgi:hypothetical protein